MKNYSEKELFVLSKQQVFLLNDFAGKNEQSRESLFDLLPCWVHLNRFKDLGLIYMNKTGLENFDVSMNDINNEGGAKFLERVIHPESACKIIPIKRKLISEENESRVISFEQKIKYAYDNNYKNHICLSILNKKLGATLTVTFPVNQLELVFKKRLFDNSQTFQKYSEGFNLLTKREKQVLQFISVGKTNREMSELLSISSLTIKTHRRNIINKLKTNKIADIIKIAIYFNLIDN